MNKIHCYGKFSYYSNKFNQCKNNNSNLKLRFKLLKTAYLIQTNSRNKLWNYKSN